MPIFDGSRTVPSVDLATDTIELVAHGLTSGQRVFYSAGDGDPIGGLTEWGEYVVNVVDANHVQLGVSDAADEHATGVTFMVDDHTYYVIDLTGGAGLGLDYHSLTRLNGDGTWLCNYFRPDPAARGGRWRHLESRSPL